MLSPPCPFSWLLQALAEGFRSCVWVALPEGWTEHHDGRVNQPYYVNAATGAKQWERPQLACALVKSTETSHMQPSALQPRRNSSEGDFTTLTGGQAAPQHQAQAHA